MTTIVDLQNAIAAAIRDAIPSLATVETTKGARAFGSGLAENDGSSITGGLGMRMPAAIVAPLSIGYGGRAGGRGGVSAANADRLLEAKVNLAAYFFLTGQDRDEAAVLMTQQFMSMLLYNQWGLKGVTVPDMDSIVAVPANIPVLTKLGVAGWGVTWWQGVRIGVAREEYEIAISQLDIGGGEALPITLDVKSQPGGVS